MDGKYNLLSAWAKGRFSVLLVCFALLFFVEPLFAAEQFIMDRVLGIMNLLVLLSCLRAVSQTRRFFRFMLAFTLINFFMGSIELISDSEGYAFQSILLTANIVYYAIIFVVILRYVLDRSSVTTDKLCGAVSAFLMMGVCCAFVYALFYHFDPASFQVPDSVAIGEMITKRWALYYSFTTLTGLGYGDITPQSTMAQSYAIMEAAAGQIYIAVILARLIALQISDEKKMT